MVIFGTNIQTRFKYIGYLDILGSYTSEPNSKGFNSKPTHKFIIFKEWVILKQNKTIPERNDSYLSGYLVFMPNWFYKLI